MSGITTHVLDLAMGRPASGVAVTLERLEGSIWAPVGEGRTDDDGRLRTLWPANRELIDGVYRLTFDTGAYFRRFQHDAFFPEASVTFEVKDPTQHYHVPLLVSPYGYSTYRGS